MEYKNSENEDDFLQPNTAKNVVEPKNIKQKATQGVNLSKHFL
jgi:hypothetical protein